MKKYLSLFAIIISIFLLAGCSIFESADERRERELNEELERNKRDVQDATNNYMDTQDTINKYNYYHDKVK